MSTRALIDFLLHDWLDVQSLCARPRFADHGPETFAQVLDTCERIAREKYAPFNRLVDEDLPTREALAQRACATLLAGQSVTVIANNKAEGSAPLSCIELAREVETLAAEKRGASATF